MAGSWWLSHVTGALNLNDVVPAAGWNSGIGAKRNGDMAFLTWQDSFDDQRLTRLAFQTLPLWRIALGLNKHFHHLFFNRGIVPARSIPNIRISGNHPGKTFFIKIQGAAGQEQFHKGTAPRAVKP